MNVAILVIDLQEKFLCFLNPYAKKRVVRAHCEFLESLRDLGHCLYLVEYNGMGPTVASVSEIADSLGSTKRLVKNGTSVFQETDLSYRLREDKINIVCATGVYAGACVTESIKDGLKDGFTIVTSRELLADTPYVPLKMTCDKLSDLEVPCFNSHQDLSLYLKNLNRGLKL